MPDLVHFQWFKVPKLDLFFIKLIKRKNIKIVFTAHNVMPHNTGNKYFYDFKKIYEFVNRIVARTDKTKEEIISVFGINSNKIQVIPHGILDLNAYKNTPFKPKDTAKDKEVVFSMLGNLGGYKEIDSLIDAWSGFNY